MKKLLILLLAWAYAPLVFAQATVNPELKESANMPYRNLNVELIPGKLLYNKVTPLDGVGLFNGANDTIVGTLGNWEQILLQMKYASFSEFTEEVTNGGAIAETYERYRYTNTVPLMLLNLEVGAIKPYALDSALIGFDYDDSTYYEIDGAEESPYSSHRVFALGPL